MSDDIPAKDRIVVREYVARDYEDILNAKYPFGTAKFGSLYKDWKSKLFDTLEQLETKRLVAYCHACMQSCMHCMSPTYHQLFRLFEP